MKDNQSILHALLNLTCICSITIMNSAIASSNCTSLQRTRQTPSFAPKIVIHKATFNAAQAKQTDGHALALAQTNQLPPQAAGELIAYNSIEEVENKLRTINVPKFTFIERSGTTSAKHNSAAGIKTEPAESAKPIIPQEQVLSAESIKELSKKQVYKLPENTSVVIKAPSAIQEYKSQPVENISVATSSASSQINRLPVQEMQEIGACDWKQPRTITSTDAPTYTTYNLQPEAALPTITLSSSLHESPSSEAEKAVQSTDPIESTEPTPPQEEETQTTAQAPLKSMLRTRSVLTAPAAQVEEESTSGTEDGAKDDADTNAEKPASAEKEKPEEVAETAEQDSNNGGDNNTQENEKNTDAQEQSSDDSAATPKAPDLNALLEASLGRAREILQTRAGSMNLLLAGNEALNNLQSAALEQLADSPNRSTIAPVCVTQIGRTRYATGSSLDLNSYSLAFGAAKQMRALTVIPFAEFGFGDSTSKLRNINPYDSKHRYYGVGSIVRLDLSPAKNHAFVDGSIRAGRVDAKHDGDNGLSYKSGYAAMHAGLGYTCTNSAGWSVDLYGRYFLNHLFSARTTLYDCLAAGDTMQLKMRSITCHTGQIGATAKRKIGNNAQLSLGLGYQYIFSGRAKGRLDGMGLVIPNAIKGSSAFAELMLKVYKTNSPLSISVGLRGYVGSKQGYAGVIRLSYQF